MSRLVCSCGRQNRRRLRARPGFPTCHRATLFSRNDSRPLSFIFFSRRASSFFLRATAQRDASLRLDARPFSSSFRSPTYSSSSSSLLPFLFSLTTVLDAVQIQSERRDMTPTFPRRWLEAESRSLISVNQVHRGTSSRRLTVLRI